LDVFDRDPNLVKFDKVGLKQNLAIYDRVNPNEIWPFSVETASIEIRLSRLRLKFGQVGLD